MSFLVLVRHGESRWNLSNKFTGWVDVPLSQKGVHEPILNANELENIEFDIAYTSELTRAQETLLLIFTEQDRTGIFLHENKKTANYLWYKTKLDKKEIAIHSSHLLNERYYGRLQGMNKNFAKKKYGEKNVFNWRRSFKIKPPGGESLEDVYKRCLPYFNKQIMADVKKRKRVIVSAHGNTLRAIIKYIEKISDENISHLELENGKPVIFKLIRNKLVKQREEFTYNRPLYWK